MTPVLHGHLCPDNGMNPCTLSSTDKANDTVQRIVVGECEMLIAQRGSPLDEMLRLARCIQQ